MARRKRPENETKEEAESRRTLESVANVSSRSEKTSWNRKMDNMVKLMALLRPIEEQIIELASQKIPILDDIQELRLLMIKECVHPVDYLVHYEDHIECKFCCHKISKVNGNEI